MRILLTLLLAITAITRAQADEGMWTTFNLPDAVYNQMQAEGFQLPKSALYDDSTALKNAVVNFSGYCTAEVVSPNGLVLTNHHCGFEAIRRHSTVEHDYMRDGFRADTITDELPCEDMFVAFMIRQQDITQRVMQATNGSLTPDAINAAINAIADSLNEQAKAEDSSYYVDIDPFYEGNAYIATTYQQYTDIRLVFAPQKGLGKFGGETDNWMWPRQTCDFSVFRIYVDPVTGKPADYSPENVPMRPKTWIRISTEGYKKGDFAMIMGYPGSTARYLSSYGIREMRDCENDPRQQVRGVKHKVLKQHMDASQAIRIMYDSKYAQSSNYWKNAIGMNKCIDSLQIIQLKEQHEDRIRQFLADHPNAMLPATDASLSPLTDAQGFDELNLDTLKALYGQRYETMRALTYFMETFTRRSNCELPTRAMRYADGMPANDADKEATQQHVAFEDNTDTWDEETDRDVFATLMENYRQRVDPKFLLSIYDDIDRDFQGDCRAYVDHIFSTSVLMKNGKNIPVKIKKKLRNDAGLKLAISMAETLADMKLTLNTCTEEIDRQERLLCLAKVRMEQDMPHYSDANFTMRLTYGQVGGYVIGDYDSGYYTTAPSLVEKMKKGDFIEDYKADSETQQLFATEDFGQYTDATSQSLNLCFLTNNDITGGNSGSPVMDGKGRLIGLAFDGNWDSLSADINYDDVLARTISVDIRYVLYIIDRWGGQQRLIDEMLNN